MSLPNNLNHKHIWEVKYYQKKRYQKFNMGEISILKSIYT